MKALLTTTAAALALAILAAAPARSEQNFDFGMYFDSGNLSCPNAATCELMLGIIPPGASVVRITQTSCTITLSNAAKIGELVLRRRRSSVLSYQMLAPIQTLPVDGTTTRYIVSASTFLALRPGDKPTVKLTLRGGAVPVVTVNCSTHGPYVQA